MQSLRGIGDPQLLQYSRQRQSHVSKSRADVHAISARQQLRLGGPARHQSQFDSVVTGTADQLEGIAPSQHPERVRAETETDRGCRRGGGRYAADGQKRTSRQRSGTFCGLRAEIASGVATAAALTHGQESERPRNYAPVYSGRFDACARSRFQSSRDAPASLVARSRIAFICASSYCRNS